VNIPRRARFAAESFIAPFVSSFRRAGVCLSARAWDRHRDRHLGWHLLRHHRRRALTNIAAAFPDWPRRGHLATIR